MAFKITRSHYSNRGDGPADIGREAAAVCAGENCTTALRLTPAGKDYLSTEFVFVSRVPDLDTLAEKLPKGEELGISPLFAPVLIDACCIRGIFPLAISLGNNTFLFGPKLHEERSLCVFADSREDAKDIKGLPALPDDCGIFRQHQGIISKKLLRERDSSSRRASFDVFVNREEDWVEALTLIREQHGENWLCEALRKCFHWMLLNQEKSTTKILLTVIRRHKYDDDVVKEDGSVNEGDLAAVELGYIVGDVYTSATGAYCLSGAGSLQLEITGEIVKRLGCRIWDLGMKMDYKKSTLGCFEVKRKKWQSLMETRKNCNIFDSPSTQFLLTDLQQGRPVTEFIGSIIRGTVNKNEQAADPNSKSQAKKRLKMEKNRDRKKEQK